MKALTLILSSLLFLAGCCLIFLVAYDQAVDAWIILLAGGGLMLVGIAGMLKALG